MLYPLSEAQIQEIDSKLPPELSALKLQHPVAVSLVADYYEAPPFPEGYQPSLIEVYFDEVADGPGIVYQSTKGYSFDSNYYHPNSSVFMMDVDHQVAFVRLGGVTLLNRTEGIVLPDVPDEIPFT